jgi:hypothetical protein
MEPRERHEIALLGVCCTTGQKDLLLMRKVVKNFFEIPESKTELRLWFAREFLMTNSFYGFFVVQVNEACVVLPSQLKLRQTC